MGNWKTENLPRARLHNIILSRHASFAPIAQVMAGFPRKMMKTSVKSTRIALYKVTLSQNPYKNQWKWWKSTSQSEWIPERKNENPYKTNENGVGINKPPRSHFTKSYEAKTLIKLMKMMGMGSFRPTGFLIFWLSLFLTSWFPFPLNVSFFISIHQFSFPALDFLPRLVLLFRNDLIPNGLYSKFIH